MPQANLTFIPTSATFPETDPSEEYHCHFINSILNYSFTSPFVDGKYCDSPTEFMPSFGFKQIGECCSFSYHYNDCGPIPHVTNVFAELHLYILSLDKNLVSFSANNTFTIHNCSSSLR